MGGTGTDASLVVSLGGDHGWEKLTFLCWLLDLDELWCFGSIDRDLGVDGFCVMEDLRWNESRRGLPRA